MAKIKSEEILPHTLVQGDRIGISVSHEMYIDGDQTWVTAKVSGTVLEDEETHDAVLRIVDTVSGAMRLSVKETVENVRKIGQEERGK